MIRFRPSSLSILAALPLATMALLGACDSLAKPGALSDQIAIDTDPIALSGQVAVSYAEVPLRAPEGVVDVFAAPPAFELRVVAEVALPRTSGVELHPTSIAFDGARAIVSYAAPGGNHGGAIDVFDIPGHGYVYLKSRVTLADSDVNAVALTGDRVWLASTIEDPERGPRGVLEALSLDEDGRLSMFDYARVELDDVAATAVAIGAGRVFAIGEAGVHALDPLTGSVATAARRDITGVAVCDAATLAVVRGSPGQLELLATRDLARVAIYPFSWPEVPPSSVAVVANKAFIAAGDRGAIVVDLASGETVARVAAPADSATTSLSVDGDLMFVASGAAGVSLVAANGSFVKHDQGLTTSALVHEVGRLELGEVGPIDYIGYHAGYLFIAPRNGSIKVARVERVVPERATNYPYRSNFDEPSARVSWQLEGMWGWERDTEGSGFLDNGASTLDQRGIVDSATLGLPLTIPERGTPVMSFSYEAAFRSPDDVVAVQVRREGGQWYPLTSFRAENVRVGWSRRTVGLDAYRGDVVQVRFQQSLGDVAGARRFAVDDFSVAQLALPMVRYPYATSFDTPHEPWNLEGSWGWSDDDTLDANPEGRSLGGFNQGQHAELAGFIAIPARADVRVELWYRSDLVDGDKVVLDIQSGGKGTWDDLAVFSAADDSDGEWAMREVSLAAYAGQVVRLRFGYAFTEAAGARVFGVASLRVGE